MTRRVVAVLAVLVSTPAAANDYTLPPAVERVLVHRDLPAEALSIYVADIDTGDAVLQWNDTVPRNPGSTIKLLTTLVAIDLLGPAYTWETKVYALGAIDAGVLDGDLLLQGNGDPFLVTERVWQLLRQIRHAGVETIAGDLLIDDSFFDVGDYDPGAFDNQPLRAYNVSPNAVLMNFKVVRYRFRPEHEAGRVSIQVDPPLANLDISNQLSLVPGPCRGYQRGIAINANETNDRMTFSGRFPTGCETYAMDRTALDHNAFVHGLFTSMWRDSGGAFSGDWRNAPAPGDIEPIVTFRSLPLRDVIARVNKHSNNVMARQLLYTLAAEVLGAPGTEAGGRKVIGDWLIDNGLAFSDFAFDNGAGLSRDARMTARDFGNMLDFAWRQPYMPEYVSSLSLAGLDGTLTYRMDDGPLEGMAHLKTGSLDHVAGVAGYLQARSGRRFVVAVLQNHTDVHRGYGEETQEALLKWLYEQ